MRKTLYNVGLLTILAGCTNDPVIGKALHKPTGREYSVRQGDKWDQSSIYKLNDKHRYHCETYIDTNNNGAYDPKIDVFIGLRKCQE